MKAPKVYVAGPITLGDTGHHIHYAMSVARVLLDEGYVPFLPHLTHFWDMAFPLDKASWLVYDFSWMGHCDALYRIPGTSSGADAEVEYARRLGIPVYHDLDHLRRDFPCPKKPKTLCTPVT